MKSLYTIKKSNIFSTFLFNIGGLAMSIFDPVLSQKITAAPSFSPA